MKTKILYEDADICVIHKPAGLATQTASVGKQDVVSELKNYLSKRTAVDTGTGKQLHSPSVKSAGAGQKGGKTVSAQSAYVGVVHRLDQPVEGILVFAKHQKAAAALTAQLQKGTLNKKYYAVVLSASHKSSEELQGTLTDYMYKNRDNMAVIVPRENVMKNEIMNADGAAGGTQSKGDHTQAKKAVLMYTLQPVGEKQPDAHNREADSRCVTPDGMKQSLYLADISIETGRFHQIRCQMAHAGMPLLGDGKYGSEESKKFSAESGVRNAALCAYEIHFKHPATGKDMHFRVVPENPAFACIQQS